jgi:YidC/Oxa1 family membrane protein insertase
MRELFSAILYDPIFNGFVALYNIIPDVGIVILVITILIKLVLYPLTSKSISAQKSLTELQPKLEELKKKYKDDQQTLATETMKMYKEHKVNPLGSCLPILVQLPIFLALYYVLRAVFETSSFDILYSFVANPGTIDPISLGLFDLSERSIILALLAGGAQFWQAKMFSRKKPPKKAGEGAKDEGMMSTMNKQMLYFMPAITVVIGIQFPGGLTLYWFLSTLLTALQQVVLFKKKNAGGPGAGGVIEGELAS